MDRSKKFVARTYSVWLHQKERAKALGQEVLYSIEDLRQVVECSYVCAYCAEPLTDASWGADHARPISRCGTFAGDNVRICCMSCNGAKGNMTEEEYRLLLACLAAFGPGVRADVLARLKLGGAVRGGRRPK